VFIDYLWNLRGAFRKVAREFYGVKGFIIPGVSTIDGKPMGGWSHYALSPTMTIWSAQSFDEFYRYTGDLKFLKTRAYPFFKEVGDALSGLLEERDGKLYLPISTSPEIHDADPEAYLKPNSNFDLALLIYLFKTLKEYCEILGKDGSRYENILNKFDDFALDEKGKMLLCPGEKLNESHRHFSHLQALYPLHVINYDTEEHKNIYQESIWELERLGTGAWVGFSFGMCAQIYAMALNGNAAYEKLRTFAKGFVAENGFHLNGDFKNYGFSLFHYRPFTLESSFGYCDALQEMLLQEHQGYIHLFPALPDEWKKQVSFKKLRSYGGVLISAEMKNGLPVVVTMEAKTPTSVLLKNTFGKPSVMVKGVDGEKTVCEKDGYFTVEITGGKVTIF
jgi:alpha-L-fucosidase 2